MPFRRTLLPVSVPGGTVIATARSVRISPAPSHVGHGFEGMRPRPRHFGHGRLTANPPCPNVTVPRPLHSSQVAIVAPLAPPVPPHVGHASVIGIETVTLPPSTAVRNGISSAVSMVSPRASSPLRPRPKIEERCRRARRARLDR
jgi:hypothetical protein